MEESPGSADPFQLSGHTIEGKYRIASVIGDGGFGVVYRGVHKGFGELIAVKCLKLPAVLDAQAREQLLELLRDEGRLLHRLSRLTPNIVQALDVGAFTTDAGVWVPFLVMEWLEGQTLASYLRDRSERGQAGMSVGDAIRLLEPAARALAVAHAQRVAHRDVKPANLFLAEAGGTRTLKVLDFGIAKMLSDCASVTEALAATALGPSAFTPRYGAPEQFNKTRGATGPWTDVFALALIFVELVSGRKALEGDDPTQLYVAAADPTFRPTLRARGVDAGEAVERVLGKALSIEPKDRYTSAGDFWDALVAAAGAGAATGAAGAQVAAQVIGGPNEPTAGAGLTGAGAAAAGLGARAAERPGFDATMPAESLDQSGPARVKVSGAGAPAGAAAPPRGPAGPLTDSMAETPAGMRGRAAGEAAQSPAGASAAASAAAAASKESAGSSASQTDQARSHVLVATPPPQPASGRKLWPFLGLAALAGVGVLAYALTLPSPEDKASAPQPNPRASASSTPVKRSSAPPPVVSATASASASAAASADAPPQPVGPGTPPEDMVYIPGGTVVLGAGPDQREVTLTRGFFIDRYEVTVRAYQACVAQRLCSAADQVSVTPEQPAAAADPLNAGAGNKAVDQFVDTWSRRCNAPRGETNHPVNCVDFASAESYCRFRNRRLPTEAEWEFAARGTARRPYAWGEGPPRCDVACYDRNGDCRPSGASVATCPAGAHPADRTPEGVYDMGGNLSEWVADGFTQPPPGGIDPRGNPAAPVRVVRGGSFYEGPEKLIATFRDAAASVTAHATIGFRCAMDSGETPAILDAGAPDASP